MPFERVAGSLCSYLKATVATRAHEGWESAMMAQWAASRSSWVSNGCEARHRVLQEVPTPPSNLHAALGPKPYHPAKRLPRHAAAPT